MSEFKSHMKVLIFVFYILFRCHPLSKKIKLDIMSPLRNEKLTCTFPFFWEQTILCVIETNPGLKEKVHGIQTCSCFVLQLVVVLVPCQLCVGGHTVYLGDDSRALIEQILGLVGTQGQSVLFEGKCPVGLGHWPRQANISLLLHPYWWILTALNECYVILLTMFFVNTMLILSYRGETPVFKV